MKYRREIDGLRTIALLPVILFHAGFGMFGGGFVGVDVFFVISGYLITTIILSELEQGRFSIVNFYERRARRILPALFLVMLVCIPFAWLWLFPSENKNFSQSLAAVSLFASNILFWRESGYFNTEAELKPLLHTWSLAVEEQYYVLFPLFLMLFWTLGKRWMLVALGLAFVGSLALAQWAVHAEPVAAFYFLPTRGWELLIGAFAAFYLSQVNRKEFGRGLSESGGWLGFALIFYAVFAYSKATPFPGFYALVPTLGALLIILFATQRTTVGKFVGNKVFVGIGLISYSAYLWHQPLFAFARVKSVSEPSQLVFSLLTILSLVLAYFSWRFVETFFRNKANVSRKGVFIFSAFGLGFFLVMGLAGHFYQDKLTRFRFDAKQMNTITTASPSPIRDACQFLDSEASLAKVPCRYFSENVKVAVLGNSHGSELAYSLASLLKEKDIGIVQHTMCACPHNYNAPSDSDSVCARWHKKVMKDLLLDKAIEVVILSYRSDTVFDNPEYRKALADTANDLVGAGKKVILVLQVPLPVAHIYRHFRQHMQDLSGSIPSRKLSEWRVLYSKMDETLKLLDKDVVVFDPADLFCDDEYCYVTKQGVSLFYDNQHISVAGGNLIAEELMRKYLNNWLGR